MWQPLECQGDACEFYEVKVTSVNGDPWTEALELPWASAMTELSSEGCWVRIKARVLASTRTVG